MYQLRVNRMRKRRTRPPDVTPGVVIGHNVIMIMSFHAAGALKAPHSQQGTNAGSSLKTDTSSNV